MAFPLRNSAISSSDVSRKSSLAIAQLLQVGRDGGIEFCGLGLLLAQLGHKSGHLFLKRFAVVVDLSRADIAAGGEDVAVLANVFDGGGFAEAGHIGIVAGVLLPAPGVVGVGDPADILFGQFAVNTINHRPEFSGVDEERLASPVPAGAGRCPAFLVAGDEPQARRDLRRIEKLSRQRHHAIHQVGLDDVLADFAHPIGWRTSSRWPGQSPPFPSGPDDG